MAPARFVARFRAQSYLESGAMFKALIAVRFELTA